MILKIDLHFIIIKFYIFVLIMLYIEFIRNQHIFIIKYVKNVLFYILFSSYKFYYMNYINIY